MGESKSRIIEKAKNLLLGPGIWRVKYYEFNDNMTVSHLEAMVKAIDEKEIREKYIFTDHPKRVITRMKRVKDA